jgi:predicted MarR family transcription regulator
MGGVHFQTNGKAWKFARSNPRELAELEEAINILESYNLITTRSAKRETFNLTADGFRLAETYELPNDA